MCSTKALLGGDGDVVADIFRNRVLKRGKGSEVWGWGTAYGKPSSGGAAQPKAETPSHDARILIVAMLAAGLLAACGEKPQTVAGVQEEVRRQGLGRGADSAYVAEGWKAGDQASWEKQLQARAQKARTNTTALRR